MFCSSRACPCLIAIAAPSFATAPKSFDESAKSLEKAITIDDAKIQTHLSEVVRSTVQDTPNALPDKDADRP